VKWIKCPNFVLWISAQKHIRGSRFRLCQPIVTTFGGHSKGCDYREDESWKSCNCPKHPRWTRAATMRNARRPTTGKMISASYFGVQTSEGNIVSHQLRDTFAVDLLQNRVLLKEVSKLLGHERCKAVGTARALNRPIHCTDLSKWNVVVGDL
jgi:hypothetical protein